MLVETEQLSVSREVSSQALVRTRSLSLTPPSLARPTSWPTDLDKPPEVARTPLQTSFPLWHNLERRYPRSLMEVWSLVPGTRLPPMELAPLLPSWTAPERVHSPAVSCSRPSPKSLVTRETSVLKSAACGSVLSAPSPSALSTSTPMRYAYHLLFPFLKPRC